MRPSISVVIPVYNDENRIRACIESIMLQNTKVPFEVIVVDDASTDGTEFVLQNMLSEHSNLNVITNGHNIGQTKSLINAIHTARGKYIAIQDSDDKSHLDRLDRQYKFLEDNPMYCAVGGHYMNVEQSGLTLTIDVIKKPTTPQEIEDYIFFDNPMCHGCVMFQQNIFYLAGGYNARYSLAQDWELFIRMWQYKLIGNLDEVVYYRSLDEKSIEKKLWAQTLECLKIQWMMLRKGYFPYWYAVYMLKTLAKLCVPSKLRMMLVRYRRNK